MDAAALQRIFQEQFPEAGQSITVAAPGRVNLIGEHTDYNDGFVLPMAVDAKIMLTASARHDRQVRVYSVDFDAKDTFALDNIQPTQRHRWTNYMRGMCLMIQEATKVPLQGMDIVMQGNVPQGAGLSSSAALEVGTAVVVNELNKLQLDPVLMATLAQKAENEFVGVQCGIMDQFISMLGEEGHALFLDCRTLEYQKVPAPFHEAGAAIAVIDTAVKRGLVDSKYNERRQQCEDAVKALQQWQPDLTSLRDVGCELRPQVDQLPDVLARRARHVVDENQRVIDSVQALRSGDLAAFGQYMNASHDSLRDDYEVSCRELDLLVDLVRANPQAYGSRMTGAGFGGCTVSLIPSTEVADLEERVLPEYQRQTGLQPRLFVFNAAAGARKLC